MRLIRPSFIFFVGIGLSGTISYFLRELIRESVYRGYSLTTNEMGRSIASALTMRDTWEVFATLVERSGNVSAAYFEDLSVSFLKTYTSPVFLADRNDEGWILQFSYPVDAAPIPIGLEIQQFENVAMCIESMESSGRSRILAFPKLLYGTEANAPDFLYCTPIKQNGSIDSFVGIGVKIDDLLNTETSIVTFIEEFDISVRVGNEYEENGVVDIFTSNANGFDEFATYSINLSPNYPVSVVFSKPPVPYWWFVYVYGVFGTIVSCLCVFLDAKYKQEGNESRQKSIFLAGISHEIRNPMNGIIGMSDLLSLEPEIPSGAVECVRVIGACSKHLLGLINNVLDLSKIESKKMTLSTQEMSTSLFHEVVTDTWRMCRRDNGTSITIVYENIPLDINVLGDSLKITQVVSNLITNAAKFTNGGSVRVDVRWEKKVGGNHAAPDTISVFLRVSDTGVGIPEASMKQLFQPFVQMTNNVSGQGTGIGLTISRSLAVAMGGGLTCTSQENEGSEFIFEFVVVGSFIEEAESLVIVDRPRQNLDVDCRPGLHLTPNSQNSQITALIVDDNVVNIRVLERMLTRLLIKCETTQSGRQAVAICKNHKYDIIFMDKFMQGVDGIETTRQIRSDGSNAETLLFFVSADVSPESREECKLAGGTDFLSKPVTCTGIEKILSAHGVLQDETDTSSHFIPVCENQLSRKL